MRVIVVELRYVYRDGHMETFKVKTVLDLLWIARWWRLSGGVA